MNTIALKSTAVALGNAAAATASQEIPQEQLLTTVRLALTPGLRRSAQQAKRIVMRSAGGRSRLVLTLAQAAILTDYFSEPTTVPAALATLLGHRDTPPWTEYGCPPLSEFYELVVQAHAAGVLVPADAPPERSLARLWPLRLPIAAGATLGILAIFASTALVAVAAKGMHFTLPATGREALVGWLVACAGLSVGQMLAACVLVGASCEARGLGLHWRTLLPHFRLDTHEAVMGGRACERTVALLRVAPVAVGVALAVWQSSTWLIPLVAAFLYVIAPWPGSAAGQWLAATHAAPRLTVRSGFLFEPRRQDFWARLSAWAADRQADFGVLGVIWIAVWTALSALLLVQIWPNLLAEAIYWLGTHDAARPRAGEGFTALIVVASLGLAALAAAKFRQSFLQRQLTRPLRSPTHRVIDPTPLEGELTGVLKRVPLFKDLTKIDRTIIASAMTVVKVKKGENVFVEDAPGDAFYVVVVGEFEVLKRNAAPATGMKTIGRLGPGDSFGEIALLDGTTRTATVRALRNSQIVRLAKWDFMKLVAAEMGTVRVRDQLQHAVFLGRLVFMADWPFADLLRFAQCCTTTRYDAGAQVLRKGESNMWFSLVFDGAFEVRDGNRVLRRLQPGDYFGEISLLENGLATADVVALEESRCLTMARNDFLAFFAHDPRIGLRMEALAAQRLGTPLFVSR